MAFDTDSVVSSRIREDQLYEAVRVLLNASVGTARVGVQADIGFGDVIHPAPVEMAFPTSGRRASLPTGARPWWPRSSTPWCRSVS